MCSLRSSTIRFATNVVGNLGAPLCLGSDSHSLSDTVETSHNPLAVSLQQVYRDEENGALIPKGGKRRPSKATAWEDVFDDEEYGRNVVFVMHRGDTVDSVGCEPDRDLERETLIAPRTGV